MKIQKLSQEAVRKTERAAGVVELSDEQLKLATGSGDLQTGGGAGIDPPHCAIHFYYPSDVLD